MPIRVPLLCASILVTGAAAVSAPRVLPAAPQRLAPHAPAEVEKADADSLPGVLERVRVAASNDDWKKQGWSDPAIEAWLEKVVAAVREAGHGQDLREPVKFARITQRGPLNDPVLGRDGPVDPAAGSLVVARALDVTRLSNTVALIDGDADVSYADYCVIIARGAVSVSHGKGNIIVAGQHLQVAHDGGERSRVAMMKRMEAEMAARGRVPPARAAADGPLPPASLLLSGGTVEVSHAGGAVCGAAGAIEITHAWGCAFVNSPNLKVGNNHDGVGLNLAKVNLGPPPHPHPLAADVRLHSAADNGTVIFWHKDRRYVAEKGKPITNEAGEPVKVLEGWVVTVADGDLAVLGNDKERASVVMRRGAGK